MPWEAHPQSFCKLSIPRPLQHAGCLLHQPCRAWGQQTHTLCPPNAPPASTDAPVVPPHQLLGTGGIAWPKCVPTFMLGMSSSLESLVRLSIRLFHASRSTVL